MDNATKHPQDELLTSYSAGSLPLSQALCISTHVEHCTDCGRKLRRLNRVGSELMNQLRPAPASEAVREKLFARLDELRDEDIDAGGSASASTVPRCLRQFVKKSYHDLPWRRVSSDIHSVELCRDSNGAKVELLKIRPGGSAHTHTHLGDEYTVILEGSFSDEDGVYREGDFLLRDQHDKHTPVATRDRECICLAVTEGPIQFTGLLTRLMNPLLRRGHA